MRRAGWAAAAAVIGWYVFALWILHPLTDAPVVDSWLYGSAVRRFLRTGEMRFAGYTQAMPIAQVVLRRRLGACIRRQLGITGNVDGGAGGVVRRYVPCARDQMRRVAMAGARGDRAADLQSLLHVPELLIHDGDSISDGDGRGAPGVRQGGRAARAIVDVAGRCAGSDRVSDSALRRDGDSRLRRRDASIRSAAARKRALGSRSVDPDDNAVGGGICDLRRAMDLADRAGAEAMGLAAGRKSFPLHFSRTARELPARWRTRPGAVSRNGVVTACAAAAYDAAMASRGNRRRGNLRFCAYPDVDGPFTARHA